MPSTAPLILQPDPAGIDRAAQLLRSGGLLGLPTETVYGLAADARNDTAVARIFAAKGRPSFNPLIVHLSDADEAEAITRMSPMARDLAQAFWPGPLTLVLPLRPDAGIADLVTAGQSTVALRVPAHPVARAVLQAFGGPVAAPSANPSGRISPTTAAHVIDGLGDRLSAVVDAGPCGVGVESTILAVEGSRVTLLRDGGLPRGRLAPLTGPLADPARQGPITAPGQLASHYAPSAGVEMDSDLSDPDAVRVGFGRCERCDLTLSYAGDMVEAAARLFAVLHEADAMAGQTGKTRIAFAPVPERGLGRAINDRLRRAAAPRG